MTDDLAPDDPAWSAIYSREIPEYHAYMRALFNDLVWWKGRQLTTGAELCTCTVTAYDTGTMFSYRRVDDSGCRYHHTGPIPAPAPFPRYGTAPACMCLYGVRRVEGAPGPYAISNMHTRYKRHEWGTWAFQIHPRCPHHGDARRADAVLEWAQQAGIKLDPWQEELVRSLFDGLSLRPRRAGLATARNIIAQYNQEQDMSYWATLREPLAWTRLDDQERRGE